MSRRIQKDKEGKANKEKNNIVLDERTIEEKKKIYLQYLRESGSLTKASRLADVPAARIIKWRMQDIEFNMEVELALREFGEDLEGIGIKRAKEGWQGRPPSDVLLMFHLKKFLSEYRDSYRLEISAGLPVSAGILTGMTPKEIEDIKPIDSDNYTIVEETE